MLCRWGTPCNRPESLPIAPLGDLLDWSPCRSPPLDEQCMVNAFDWWWHAHDAPEKVCGVGPRQRRNAGRHITRNVRADTVCGLGR